jgi:SAM-dependent methyltransferase
MGRVSSPQAEINTGVWRDADRVADYSSGQPLRPVEALIMERERAALAGAVLEVGCGAGRLTRHLTVLSPDVQAFDVSPRMVEACARACPAAAVRVGDLRDLAPYADRAFAVVWVGFNTIDILDDGERAVFLDACRDRLAPGGLLVFSSHNLASAFGHTGPWGLLSSGGLRQRARAACALPQRLRNHRRTAPLEYRTATHAVLADEENDFAGLHYYVGRDTQEQQLATHGLALVDCRELDGTVVPPGGVAAMTPELHYVARR